MVNTCSVEQPGLGIFFLLLVSLPFPKRPESSHSAAAAAALSTFLDSVPSQGTASVLNEVGCYSLLSLKVINNSRQKYSPSPSVGFSF